MSEILSQRILCKHIVPVAGCDGVCEFRIVYVVCDDACLMLSRWELLKESIQRMCNPHEV